MMEREAILLVMSRVLDYPDERFFDEQHDMKTFIKEYVAGEKGGSLWNALQPLYEMSLKEIQELYVETFDYKDKTSFYLTAHELGDSRNRGAALIQLQKLICEAGFEHNNNQLADYIPMLLELLAHGPKGDKFEKLKERLGFAFHRILNALDPSHPYYQVIEVLTQDVLETPDSEEVKQKEGKREYADLDELPYPLLYQ
jgi:nitrate reductase molybdenum cofactor assembly chaperone NarJ/NarW